MNEYLDELDALSENAEEILADAYLQSIADAQENVDLDALTSAIDNNDTAQALAVLGNTETLSGPIHEALNEHFYSYAIEMILAALFLTIEAMKMRLKDRSGAAQVKIDQLISVQFKNISHQTIQALRYSIEREIANNTPPKQAALRIIQRIGLTEPQLKSLYALEDALNQYQSRPNFTIRARFGNRTITTSTPLPVAMARNVSASQRSALNAAIRRGLTPETTNAFLTKQINAMAKQRAKALAAYEANYAVNAGQHSAWLQAASENAVPFTQIRRYWIDKNDERVRQAHAAVKNMNPQGVGLEQTFKTPFGNVMYPPLEAYCRCRILIKQVKHV